MEQRKKQGDKCSKHPKYDGKKKPPYKNPCFECLEIYLKKRSNIRAPHKPTRAHRDKTKYTRKKKHPESD